MKLSKYKIRSLIESVINEFASADEDGIIGPGRFDDVNRCTDGAFDPRLKNITDEQAQKLLSIASGDERGEAMSIFGYAESGYPYVLVDKSGGDKSYVYVIDLAKTKNKPRIAIVRTPSGKASFKNPIDLTPGSKGYQSIYKLFAQSLKSLK